MTNVLNLVSIVVYLYDTKRKENIEPKAFPHEKDKTTLEQLVLVLQTNNL